MNSRELPCCWEHEEARRKFKVSAGNREGISLGSLSLAKLKRLIKEMML